jgi:hypothetical protein
MVEMQKIWQAAMVLGAGALALGCACGVARAQGSCTFTDENGKTVTWVDCKPPADAKPVPPAAVPAKGAAPKSFPFPGSDPAAVPAAPAPAPAAAPQAAGQSPAAKPGPVSPHKFDYPGEDPSGAEPAAGTKPAPPSGSGLQDAGSSGESSSSSSSSSTDAVPGDFGSDATDNDPAAKAAAARKAERRRLKGAPVQTSDEREIEDLKVAGFYQNDGNFRGAYLRAQDAVSLAGDDPEAHLALAEAARRLGKLDEAETHYKKCLTLDPTPKDRKTAEKALKEMSGG